MTYLFVFAHYILYLISALIPERKELSTCYWQTYSATGWLFFFLAVHMYIFPHTFEEHDGTHVYTKAIYTEQIW